MSFNKPFDLALGSGKPRRRHTFYSTHRILLLLLNAALAGVIWSPGFAQNTFAQQLNISIRFAPGPPACALVEGSSGPGRSWSFRNDYAGVSELGNRITGFKVFDSAGVEVRTRRLAPGQYAAESAAKRFQFQVALAPPRIEDQDARTSWLEADRGLIMLADLLPEVSESATRVTDGGESVTTASNTSNPVMLSLLLPPGWVAYSSSRLAGPNTFAIEDSESSVLVIGSRLRKSTINVFGMTMDVVTEGTWPFTDDDIRQMADRILRTHQSIFGSRPADRSLLSLLSFPHDNIGSNKWSAETRGTAVTVILAKQPSKTAAHAQLEVALTHELFHLWVPNGLALRPNYDWFYEGFTVYTAARAGVRMGSLSFQDFLNAIARAYDLYLATAPRDQWSLVDASTRRWTTQASLIYAKSMLIAFLYDLNLRRASRRKDAIDDVYRSLAAQFGIEQHPDTSPPVDGTGAIIEALDAKLPGFPDTYIRKPVTIDLGLLLQDFGLRVEKVGLRNRLIVNESLTGKQKALLRDLGYNDSVRLLRKK